MQIIFEESFHILLWPLSWVYWFLKYMQSALLPKIVLINIHQLISQDNRSMPSYQHKSQMRWDCHSIHTILNLVTTIHTLMYNTQKNGNAITQDIIYGKGHMDTNLVLCFWRTQLKLNLNLWLFPQHTEGSTVTSWLSSNFKWGMKRYYLFTYLILLPVVALCTIIGDHLNLGPLNNKTGIDRDLQDVVGKHV